MSDKAALELGRRIAEARKQAGLTQEDLAKVLGLSRSSVANIETGRQELSATHLIAIGSALGSSIAELADAPAMPWLELARQNTKERRQFEARADACWRNHDYLTAIRYRGVAEGLEIATANQFDLLHPERATTQVGGGE